jgi:cell division protein FtsI (penicillin-binding protein 3)
VTALHAFARSLNSVHAQYALQMGPERFYHHVTNFGFGRLTGIPLPGERPGWIGALTNRAGAAHAYAAFGQGIAATQLQMTMAFCAVVNGGWLLRPMLVARVDDAAGQPVWRARTTPVHRVLRPQTSAWMREALEAVVQPGGTGTRAAIPDVPVGGKTATAQKAGPAGQGYLEDRFYASFIGAVPIHDPEFVISVVVDEPEIGHAGGAVAAPVFRRLASEAIRFLEPPSASQTWWTAADRRLR